jgi:hypothetical protein
MGWLGHSWSGDRRAASSGHRCGSQQESDVAVGVDTGWSRRRREKVSWSRWQACPNAPCLPRAQGVSWQWPTTEHGGSRRASGQANIKSYVKAERVQTEGIAVR